MAIAVLPAAAESGGPSSHRARMSRDIAERLSQRIESSTRIIVSASDQSIDQLVARYGARLTKRIQGGAVLEATGGQLDALSQDPDVAHIAGDAKVYRTMAVTTQSTGADQVWNGLEGLRGFTGRGIGVAVIDSGIAPHSQLRNHVVVAMDFTESNTGRDEYGHGTHVAGIIGEGDRDGYSGMAPGAWLVSLKVLAADGSGNTSDVIEAIDWAIKFRRLFNIRVINLSLGHPVFESYLDDPLCQAAQRAVDAGIVVVAAAGNMGRTDDGRPVVGGIIAPGNTPSVLTVGAVNTRGTAQRSDDIMATYSSRGPTAIDGVLKPELVAPGNRIVAAAAEGSYLATTYPDRVVRAKSQSAYIELSGTSMAAAVVSGAAALVLEARPTLTPAQVKATLQLTSSRVAGAGLIEAGAGSLNVAAAVTLIQDRQPKKLARIQIANEPIDALGLAYGSLAPNLSDPVTANILVWGGSQSSVWGTALRDQPILTWNGSVGADILVWGGNTVNGNTLVWGNSVTADTLVWGNSVSADILVWGNTLVWGNGAVQSDILIWGNRTDADILVLGN